MSRSLWAIDLTSTGGVAALKLLPGGGEDAIAAILPPEEAHQPASELHSFGARHGA